MAELTLYHIAPSRGSIALWMLEETGAPYRVELLDMAKGENRLPAYLAINPMGKVPAIRHGETIVTEVAAICLYLAEAFPAAGLNVPVGDPRRGAFLKWLFFSVGPLEAAVTDRAFKRAEEAPRAALGYGDFDTTMEVVAAALKPGPYLLGDQFTAADLMIGSQLRWATMFKLVPEREDFAAYLDRLTSRPAAQRAQAKDDRFKV